MMIHVRDEHLFRRSGRIAAGGIRGWWIEECLIGNAACDGLGDAAEFAGHRVDVHAVEAAAGDLAESVAVVVRADGTVG